MTQPKDDKPKQPRQLIAMVPGDQLQTPEDIAKWADEIVRRVKGAQP